MVKGKPIILNMSDRQKRATIDAIYEAINISTQKSGEIRKTITIKEFRNKSLQTTIRRYFRSSKVPLALIIGRTQQRYLKHKIRQFDVRLESIKIAQETGATFDKVEKIFLENMDRFTMPKQ